MGLYILTMRKHRLWLWILLFSTAAFLMIVMGTSWNLVVVEHYQTMLDRAREIDFQNTHIPWLTHILGSLAFIAALTVVILLFLKLLREMRLTQLQSEFLARVSHELKTPISTIELTSDLLKRSDPQLDRQALWKAHDEELARLKLEVESLLQAARWENLQPKAQWEVIGMKRYFESRKTRWQRLLGSHITLNLDFPSEDIQIKMDCQLLDLILDNIIINTKKFAQKNGTLKISFEIDAQTRWTLILADDVSGFSPKIAKKIFHKFFTDPDRKKGYGSGLGLYIASRSAKALKTELKALSLGEGQGASFILTGKA